MVVWLDEERLILEHFQEKVLCSIYYKSDALSIKSLKDDLVYVARKRVRNASRENEDITLFEFIKLLKELVVCFVADLWALSVDLCLLVGFDLYVDPRDALSEHYEICDDALFDDACYDR